MPKPVEREISPFLFRKRGEYMRYILVDSRFRTINRYKRKPSKKEINDLLKNHRAGYSIILAEFVKEEAFWTSRLWAKERLSIYKGVKEFELVRTSDEEQKHRQYIEKIRRKTQREQETEELLNRWLTLSMEG